MNSIGRERQNRKKSDRQREILNIFREWRAEKVTEKKIEELLKERSHRVSSRTIYRDLIELSNPQNGPLCKNRISPKGCGRPREEFTINIDAVYQKLGEAINLLDAMGFAQGIESHPGKTFITKAVIKHRNGFQSLRAPPKSDVLDPPKLAIMRKRATEDDLNETWKLSHHIMELQNYCNNEDPAYKEYDYLKYMLEMMNMGEAKYYAEKFKGMKSDFEKKYGIPLIDMDTEYRQIDMKNKN